MCLILREKEWLLLSDEEGLYYSLILTLRLYSGSHSSISEGLFVSRSCRMDINAQVSFETNVITLIEVLLSYEFELCAWLVYLVNKNILTVI